MKFEISGKVYERESGLGVPNLLVRAIDKDLIYDDLLGSARTDADGGFSIIYHGDDFRELFDRKPDVYVEVKTRDHADTLYTSEKAVRWQADSHEVFTIALSRQELGPLSPSEKIGLGPKRERVTARVTATNGKPIPGKKILLVAEHKRIGKKQRKVVLEDGSDFVLDFPPGTYSVQAFAEGHGVAKAVAKVEPGKSLDLDLELEPVEAGAWKKSFEERLAVYSLTPADVNAQELTLDEGQHLVLSHRTKAKLPGLKEMKANSIAELKQWVGNRGDAFGHDEPRFGALPAMSDALGEPRTKKAQFAEVSATLKRQIEHVAHEYLQGNARSVAQFEKVLDSYIVAIHPGGLTIPGFFYTIVTIGPGAVLEIGHDTSVLFADKLRIHTSGTLKVVGDCTVDVGVWEEYS